MRQIGVGEVIRRHTTFWAESSSGGDGRCPGSLAVAPKAKKA